MPGCATKYFGIREYTAQSLITMPCGLHGFGRETAFLLIQISGQEPLAYLQSVISADLCFMALPILAVDRTYSLCLDEADAALIGTTIEPEIGRDVLCLAILTVRPSAVTANLLAPVVLNLRTRNAAQCINMKQGYSHQHMLQPHREGLAA